MYTSAQRHADELRGIVAPAMQDDEDAVADTTAAPMDEDDELMELAAMDPAAISRHANVPDDDDELEALMRMPVNEPDHGMAPDDELEALAAANPVVAADAALREPEQPAASDALQAETAVEEAMPASSQALVDEDMQELAGTQLAGTQALGDEDMQELAGEAEAEAVQSGEATHADDTNRVAGDGAAQGASFETTPDSEVDELDALLGIMPAHGGGV